jgi:hypothetical protein
VPRGAERLRITPSPLHSDADIEALLAALDAVWTAVGARREGVVDQNHPLAQLCPVVGPQQADPAELGVDHCPWGGEGAAAQAQAPAAASTPAPAAAQRADA